MDSSRSCKHRVSTNTPCDGHLKHLLDYFRHELPEDFWGNVVVKFKNGVPYMVEEQRQIKLDNSR